MDQRIRQSGLEGALVDLDSALIALAQVLDEAGEGRVFPLAAQQRTGAALDLFVRLDLAGIAPLDAENGVPVAHSDRPDELAGFRRIDGRD